MCVCVCVCVCVYFRDRFEQKSNFLCVKYTWTIKDSPSSVLSLFQRKLKKSLEPSRGGLCVNANVRVRASVVSADFLPLGPEYKVCRKF